MMGSQLILSFATTGIFQTCAALNYQSEPMLKDTGLGALIIE
jgi:hypothetical protein